ncbi:MAG: hypothetical protein P4L35_07025 [Ignavibacteriaceae bacterium]|nr:hypothetical protein [Ignavibacteriaceae bacterium]
MRIFYLVSISLLIISNNLYPQLKIKEKIDIKPISKTTSNATGGDLRFVLSVPNQGPNSSFHIGDSCGFSGASCDITFHNTSSSYEFNFNFDVTVGVYYEFKIYFCGYLIDSSSGLGMQLYGTCSPSCYDSRWTNFRGLDLEGTGGSGNYIGSNVVINVDTDNNICDKGVFWNAFDTLFLRLSTSHAEFFNRVTQRLVGNSVSCSLNDRDNYFIISKLPSTAAPEIDTLTAIYEGISTSTNIMLAPQGRFYISKDEFYYPKAINLHLDPYNAPDGYDGTLEYIPAILRIAQGNQYVSIIDRGTFDTLGDNITLYAADLNRYALVVNNPSLAEDSTKIVVEYELLGNIQADTIYLKPSLFVNIIPPVVGSGDTATVIIQRKNAYTGELEEFLPSSGFEIGILDGCINGNCLVEGKLAYYFDSVKVPIRFVAANHIDSGEVKIKVGYTEDISACVSLSHWNKKNPTLKNEKINNLPKRDIEKFILEKNNKSNKKKNINASNALSPNLDGPHCFIDPFINMVSVCKQFFVKNYKLIIISPTKYTKIEEISKEPKMPPVLCKAILLNYSGNVNFDWEYWVSYTSQRCDFHDTIIKQKIYHYVAVDWPRLCSRVAKFCFIGRSSSQGQNEITTTWKVGFIADSLQPMYVKAPMPQRAIGIYTKDVHPPDKKHPNVWHWHGEYPGDTTEIIQKWDPGDGKDVFTGGCVWVKVTAKKENGEVIAWDTTTANLILGNNPDPKDLASATEDKRFKAILTQESGNVKQFSNGTMQNKHYPFVVPKGFPLYGHPNGYGLMQIDNSPEPSELDLWNWRSNVYDGKTKLKNLIVTTKNYLKNKYAEDSPIFLKNLFQKYNDGAKGHQYSIWDGDQLIDNIGHQAYGNAVYNIYINPNN